jgi:hypothetical protein
MRRVYHIDRLLKRLDQLLSDAEFLEDLTDLLRRESDRQLLTQVCDKYEQVHISSGFLEVELTVSSLGRQDNALMVFQLLGDPREAGMSEWLRSLASMYARWFHRKGYTYEFASVRWPGSRDGRGAEPALEVLEADRLADVLRKIRDLRLAARLVCTLESAAVLAFVKGEQGIHRLRGKVGDSDPGGGMTRLVRVHVIQTGPDLTAKGWFEESLAAAREARKKKDTSWQTAMETEEERTIDEVVRDFRITEETRRVEDPRTGLELTSVTDVLDGDLDAFVLSVLRAEMAAQRGVRAEAHQVQP